MKIEKSDISETVWLILTKFCMMAHISRPLRPTIQRVDRRLTSADRQRAGPLAVGLADAVRPTEQFVTFDTRVANSVGIDEHVAVSSAVRGVARMAATTRCRSKTRGPSSG